MKLTENIKAHIYRLHSIGRSLEQIATATGISQPDIQALLVKAGKL